MPETQGKAIVLLSGGLDSTTTLAIAKSEGHSIFALTFDYGQRNEFEIKAARKIATQQGVVRHVVTKIDLREFGGSALTSEIEVPLNRNIDKMSHEIPVTYVPARNTIFLSFALAWAEVEDANDIFIGVNALDFSGYPDCRPEYIEAYQRMANLATKAGVEGRQRITIHTPLIVLSKAQIIKKGLELGVDYSFTSTCYQPSSSGEACGRCDACQLRLRGFSENNLTDPIRYISQL
jgi:7-cyano-7-deazaguanine synthase